MLRVQCLMNLMRCLLMTCMQFKLRPHPWLTQADRTIQVLDLAVIVTLQRTRSASPCEDALHETTGQRSHPASPNLLKHPRLLLVEILNLSERPTCLIVLMQCIMEADPSIWDSQSHASRGVNGGTFPGHASPFAEESQAPVR